MVVVMDYYLVEDCLLKVASMDYLLVVWVCLEAIKAVPKAV